MGKTVKFYPNNIVGNIKNWNSVNCNNMENGIALLPNGCIYIDIVDTSKIKASLYTKLVVKASGSIDTTNNYTSGTDILIGETYIKEDGNIKRQRCLGITPLSSSKNDNVYTDTTIINMLNYHLKKLSIKVVNNTPNVLNVYSVELYRSKDIDGNQLSEIIMNEVAAVKDITLTENKITFSYTGYDDKLNVEKVIRNGVKGILVNNDLFIPIK